MKKNILKNVLLVVVMMILSFAVSTTAGATVYSGNCGVNVNNITWSLDTATRILKITGSGEMEDITQMSYHPWSSHRDYIEKVEMTGNITSIGEYAFFGLYYLEEISIPDTVTKIGNHVFEDCSRLYSISLPNNLQILGNNVFAYSGIEKIAIPDSVTDINIHRLCCNCSNLKSININNEKYTSVDGVVYNKDMTELVSCPAGRENYTIPSSVTTIGAWAFDTCSKLSEITIPETVTSIEKSAFNECASIKELVIPDSVTTIGSSAFAECPNLKSVKISNNIIKMSGQEFYNCYNLEMAVIGNKTECIGSYSFSGCNKLKNVVIPVSVTNIASGAFYMCNSLTDIYYSGTEEQWEKISVGSSNEPLENATIHFMQNEEENPTEHTHSYNYIDSVKNATCIQTGVVRHSCSCGDSYTEETPLIKDNHLGEKEKRNAINSTCTEKGYTGDTYCLDCGEMVSIGSTINATGHSYDENGVCVKCSDVKGTTHEPDESTPEPEQPSDELTNDCNCMCHKGGFIGLIYKIIRFFWKLFKTNSVCDCGAAHY